MYYIASYSYVRIGASLTPGVDIIKMDPATGNREYVWRSNHLGYNFGNEVNPYGHCPNGRTAKFGYRSVQFGRKAFGIDAAVFIREWRRRYQPIARNTKSLRNHGRRKSQVEWNVDVLLLILSKVTVRLAADIFTELS